MTARDLELRATTVYAERNLRAQNKLLDKREVCRLVGQIKPKFSYQEIELAIDELNEKRHIQLQPDVTQNRIYQ